MKTLAVLLSLLSLAMLVNVYAQEPTTLEQVSDGGSVKVQLTWPEVIYEKIQEFSLKFLDPDNNELLTNVKFDVVFMQGDVEVDDYFGMETATGDVTLSGSWCPASNPSQHESVTAKA